MAHDVPRGSQAENDPSGPGIEMVFKGLAILLVAGGAVLSAILWPRFPPGFEWANILYIPSVTWFSAGLLSACLLWAIADLLKYLHRIERSLRRER